MQSTLSKYSIDIWTDMWLNDKFFHKDNYFNNSDIFTEIKYCCKVKKYRHCAKEMLTNP
jgi:hypothetical protein